MLPADSVSVRTHCLIEEGALWVFYDGINPIHYGKAQKAPPPNSFTLGVKFQHMNFGGRQTPSLCQKESCPYAVVKVQQLS